MRFNRTWVFSFLFLCHLGNMVWIFADGVALARWLLKRPIPSALACYEREMQGSGTFSIWRSEIWFLKK